MRIYAKQVPPDIQESHFDIGMYPDVTITENSNFNEYKSDLYKRVEDYLEDAYREFDEFEDGEREPDDAHLNALIQTYFGVLPRSVDERLQWRKLLSRRIFTSVFATSLKQIARIMSLISGKPYDVHDIHGCCQSDWNCVICPDEMTVGRPSSLQAIESEYFNTGSEWMVYESEDACEAECDGTSIYVLDMQNPREVIADCYGVMPADVEAYAFDRYEKIPKYKRMEDAV